PCVMSPERLMASYLVRVAFRDGRREVGLHAIRTGETYRLRSYRELVERLQAMEDGGDGDGRAGPVAR
ncbi:MAG: hypothetical protein WD336_04420, partial [Trueperaceae bacterium]